jgi:mannosyl-3-phosphoglycerate phosphatase
MKDLLVVTDLDGTLLDEQTYAVAAAAPALRGLAAAGVPLVLASSKTRVEMERLAATLPGMPPLALIVENGGAIVRDRGHERREITVLGAPHEKLVGALALIANEAGARVTGFSALSPPELSRLTGLSAEEARHAQLREYDEPFLMEEGDLARVAGAAARHGLRVTRGGRFLHLTGATDKGRALRVLLGLLAAGGRLFHTVGLGDAPNDVPLLQAVDEPILVPRPSGRVHERLRQAFPHATQAPTPGPEGWNAAVLDVLERRARDGAPGSGGGKDDEAAEANGAQRLL